jgi:hypothetical protein
LTGEAKYWREGSERRRQLTEQYMGEAQSVDGDPMGKLEAFKQRIEAWCISGETPLRAFFSRGVVKKLEL